MAHRAGLPPSEFWKLTPWQLLQCVQSHNEQRQDEHRLRGWLAWHIAVLSRTSKIPPLRELIAGKQRGIDEAEIKARFMAHNQAVEMHHKE